MKKYLFFSIIGLCMLAIPAFADGNETLKPTKCSIENKLVYEPINEVHITFAGHVGIAEDAKATIMCDGKTMATGTISSYTYKEEGIATIAFDKLVLPKGKTYKLEIPSGAIYLTATPTVKVANLKFDFTVPEKITGAECSVKNGSVVVTERLISFGYRTETEPIGNPTMTLYREGVPVRTFEAHVNWDWGIGQAYADFGKEMNFEKDVHYSLVLPEGSLSPRFRTDITNEEARVDFIGGYTEPLAPINYVWCSLFDEHNIDVLNEVRFFYKQAIVLSPNPKIQLFDNDHNLLKEVTPTLTEENGQWVVSCNFGGVKVPEGGCCITIPEGTVISANGDVTVNAKNTFNVNVTTQVGSVSNRNMEVKAADRSIVIDNAPVGGTLSVYSADGKKIAERLVTAPRFTVELPSKGIYIVAISGKAYKVTVR